MNINPHTPPPPPPLPKSGLSGAQTKGRIKAGQPQNNVRPPHKIAPPIRPTTASTNLTTRSVSTQVPANANSLSIITFLRQQFAFLFGPLFGYLTDQEEKDAKFIKNILEALESILDSSDDAAKQQDRITSQKLPVSAQTLKQTSLNFEKIENDFESVNLFLSDLQAYKTQANHLASQYSRFSDLPAKIQAIENKILHSKGRMDITQALHSLEEKLAAYNADKNWDNFEALTHQRHVFEAKLKEILLKDPTLKSKKAIQEILQSPKKLTSQQVHDLVKKTQPILSNQTDRALKGLLHAQHNQINRLTNNVKNLEIQFKNYDKISTRINELEYSLHGNSLTAIIYRAFNRPTIKNDLKNAKSHRREIVGKINQLNVLKPNERIWFSKIALSNKKYQSIAKQLNELPQRFKQLSSRESVIEKLNSLIYRSNDINTNFERLEGLDDAGKDDPIEKKRIFNRMNDGAIGIDEDFTAIATEIQSLSQGFIKTSRLPKDFEKMKPINQLVELIKVHYPQTNQIADIIPHLFKEQNMDEEINEMILKAWQPIEKQEQSDLEETDDSIKLEETNDSIKNDVSKPLSSPLPSPLILEDIPVPNSIDKSFSSTKAVPIKDELVTPKAKSAIDIPPPIKTETQPKPSIASVPAPPPLPSPSLAKPKVSATPPLKLSKPKSSTGVPHFVQNDGPPPEPTSILDAIRRGPQLRHTQEPKIAEMKQTVQQMGPPADDDDSLQAILRRALLSRGNLSENPDSEPINDSEDW